MAPQKDINNKRNRITKIKVQGKRRMKCTKLTDRYFQDVRDQCVDLTARSSDRAL